MEIDNEEYERLKGYESEYMNVVSDIIKRITDSEQFTGIYPSCSKFELLSNEKIRSMENKLLNEFAVEHFNNVKGLGYYDENFFKIGGNESRTLYFLGIISEVIELYNELNSLEKPIIYLSDLKNLATTGKIERIKSEYIDIFNRTLAFMVNFKLPITLLEEREVRENVYIDSSLIKFMESLISMFSSPLKDEMKFNLALNMLILFYQTNFTERFIPSTNSEKYYKYVSIICPAKYTSDKNKTREKRHGNRLS